MRVLITGGLGFVGLHLVGLIVRERPDWIVHLYDDESVGRPADLSEFLDWTFGVNGRKILLERITITPGDVRNLDRLQTSTADCDAVVHLASRTSVQASLQNPRESIEVSALGTFNVLEACRAGSVRRVVLASSNAAAGEQGAMERTLVAPRPVSPYGAGKSCLEALASAYWRSYGLETVCFRFANVYGPFSHRKSSVVARWIDRVLKGIPIEIYGDGSQTRDFLYACDTARVLLLSLEASSEIAGRVLQIGSGIETTVSELADILCKVSGRDIEITFLRPLPGEIHRIECDISEARKILGLGDMTPLIEGLRETWKWFVERGQAAEDGARGEPRNLS